LLLSDVLAGVPLRAPLTADVEVSGLAYDSRRVAPGDCYFAIRGLTQDGHVHVADAVARGAVAVVAEEPRGGVALALVDDSRRALALAAANLQAHPSRALYVVGITGTDGKTTTCAMTTTILDAAGFATGMLTTVDVRAGGLTEPNPAHVTTPEAVEVQAQLRRMVDAGDRCAVVETSSHALRMQRVVGVEYDVAVLTNVTSEHLELHGTVEEYRRDKARLFQMLGDGPDKGIGKTGVVNADDPNARMFIEATAGEVLTYGLGGEAELRGEAVDEADGGITFVARRVREEARVRVPMMGRFNVHNALAALAAASAVGVSLETGAAALATFAGVRGRMERIEAGQHFGVIVDYAHTAEALATVLGRLRERTGGRVIVVFGSAGDRDRAKRPAMGAAAARLADFAILTDEDPRHEDRDAILREIAAGLEVEGASEGSRYRLVADRREAIAQAFAMAAPGDTVLLAGKGHENTIETATGAVPWDEAAVARELLRDLQA